jgi:hypothetical protein
LYLSLPLLDSLDPAVTFVVALIKQGDHNPETFFSPPPTTWGFEGADKLSEVGFCSLLSLPLSSEM